MGTRQGQAFGLLLGAFFLAIAGCAGAPAQGTAPAAAPAAKEIPAPAKAGQGHKFVCACGPSCTCESHADKPGMCTCGKPMTYKKILREDTQYYWVCPCEKCSCDTISEKDPSRCSCGKELQAIVKTGKYACSCGGCDCNMSSAKQGPCVCGVMMQSR